MSSRAAIAPRTSAWSSASSSRIMTVMTAPPRVPGSRAGPSRPPTVSRAPSASARRRRPRRPCPSAAAGAAARRRRRRSPRCPGRAAPRRGAARLCRTMLVTASRMVQANSSRSRRRHLVGRAGQVGLDVRRGQRLPGGGDLPGQRDAAHAQRGGPHVGQRVAGQPLQVAQLGAGPVQVDVEQPLGQLRLDRRPRSASGRGCRAGRRRCGPARSATASVGQLRPGPRPAAACVRRPAGCPQVASGAEQHRQPVPVVLPAGHQPRQQSRRTTNSTAASGTRLPQRQAHHRRPRRRTPAQVSAW